MRFITHAAGFAAAALLVIGGAFYAGPSLASDAVVPETAISYLDHASATLEPSDAGLNPAEVSTNPAPVANISTDAATHAATAPQSDLDSPPVRSLAELVDQHAGIETADAEQECLAGAVYFEAKGESLKGQLSVAEVVLNRARSGRFPSSICGVVTQRGQFSFIRGGRFPAIARASQAWQKAVAIARIAMQDLADSPAPRALFFHATYVSPGWRGLTRVATVGNHIFYR